MSSAVPPPITPVLLYDGLCPMCRRWVRLLERLGLLGDIPALPWPDAGLDSPALASRLREELVLYDQTTGTLQGGVEGLLALMQRRSGWRPVAALFRLPGLNLLARALYRTAALNRRILSPRPHPAMACACDPPFDVRARLGLWFLLLVVAVGGSMLFGMALSGLHPVRPPLMTGVRLTLAAGAGWALNFLLMPVFLKERVGTFLQQCLVVMAIGILWLVPVMLAFWISGMLGLPSAVRLALVWAGVAFDSAMMFRAMRRRCRTLELPVWTPWIWLLLLQAGGLPLMFHFHVLTLEG